MQFGNSRFGAVRSPLRAVPGRFIPAPPRYGRGGLGELPTASSIFSAISSGAQQLAQTYYNIRAARSGVQPPQIVNAGEPAPVAAAPGMNIGTVALLGGGAALAFVLLRKRRR